MREHDDPYPAGRGSGKGLVPPGHVLIGANYNPRTGDIKHTILMNDDVDPAVLQEILNKLPSTQVTRRRYGKLRLPGQKQGDPMRSFKSRILLRPGFATSSFNESLTRQIAALVLHGFLRQIADTVEEVVEKSTPAEPPPPETP